LGAQPGEAFAIYQQWSGGSACGLAPLSTTSGMYRGGI